MGFPLQVFFLFFFIRQLCKSEEVRKGEDHYKHVIKKKKVCSAHFSTHNLPCFKVRPQDGTLVLLTCDRKRHVFSSPLRASGHLQYKFAPFTLDL